MPLKPDLSPLGSGNDNFLKSYSVVVHGLLIHEGIFVEYLLRARHCAWNLGFKVSKTEYTL